MINQLSSPQLVALDHRNLYRHFCAVRSHLSLIANYYGRRCCEVCHEYVGGDWEADVGVHLAPWQVYLEGVRGELQSRPYRDFSRRAALARQRDKVADLRGNRRPRNRHHRKPVKPPDAG